MPKPQKSMKNKKAVSTIVGALMMVVLVAVAGAAAVSVSTLMLETWRSTYQERLVIDDVWFKPSPPRDIEISVYNCGKIPITINAVYVNNDLVLSNLNVSVDVNGNSTLTVSGYAWSHGTTYLIKLATSRGTTYESLWKP